MHERSVTRHDCVPARQQISLRLDGELSEFEEDLLEAHLRVCGHCRSYASEVAGTTAALRAAPLEKSIPVQLPRRHRRRVSAVGAFSVAATITVVMVSGAVGLRFSRTQTVGAELRPTHQYTILMERQLNGVGSVDRKAARRTPLGLRAAERLTVEEAR